MNRRKDVDPKVLPDSAKQKFAGKISQLMQEKGWRQSDLARQAGLPRDAVSVYMRGRSLPTPGNLEKLAKALDVAPDDLLPAQPPAKRDPRYALTATDQPGIVVLRVNQEVPEHVAFKIIEMLRENSFGQNSTDGPRQVETVR